VSDCSLFYGEKVLGQGRLGHVLIDAHVEQSIVDPRFRHHHKACTRAWCVGDDGQQALRALRRPATVTSHAQ
jgi:hypothetical protein